MDEKAVRALIHAALIPCNAEIALIQAALISCNTEIADLKVRVEMLEEDIRVITPDKVHAES